MFCQHCGAELQAADKFCPSCGRSNSEGTSPSPAQIPQEPISPDAPPKGKGTAALVLGIISLSIIILPLPLIGGTVAPIASIVLAIISLALAHSFKKLPKAKGGSSAKVGRLLSILGIIVSIIKLLATVVIAILGIVFNLFAVVMSFITTALLPMITTIVTTFITVVIPAIVSIIGIVLPFLLQ